MTEILICLKLAHTTVIALRKEAKEIGVPYKDLIRNILGEYENDINKREGQNENKG